MKLSDFLFSKNSRDSEALVTELRELNEKMPKGKLRAVKLTDGRKNLLLAKKKAGNIEHRRAELLRQIEAVNRPYINRYQEQCLQRLKALPSMRTVEELSSTHFVDGTLAYKVKINAEALERFKNAVLEAIDNVRGMISNSTLAEIQAAISEYNNQFDSFDFSELEVVEMRKDQLQEWKQGDKQPPGHISTAHMGPTGPIVLQNDADLAPRVKNLTDRINKLEKGV